MPALGEGNGCSMEALLGQLYNGGGGQQSDAAFFESDQFRMYCYKVIPCSKTSGHDWTECNFCHPGEKATRRDPTKHVYAATACPEMKRTGECARGESCPFAHNVFEYWMHPNRYRTQMCSYGTACKRSVCFFAHQYSDLRVSEQSLQPEYPAAGSSWGNNQRPAALDCVQLARLRVLQQGLCEPAVPQQLLQQHTKLQAAVHAARTGQTQSQQWSPESYAGGGGRTGLLSSSVSLPSDALMHMELLQHGQHSLAVALLAQQQQQQAKEVEQQQQQQLAAALQLLGRAHAPVERPKTSTSTPRPCPKAADSSNSGLLPASPFSSPFAGLGLGSSLQTSVTDGFGQQQDSQAAAAAAVEMQGTPFAGVAQSRLLALLPQLLQHLQGSDDSLQSSFSGPAAVQGPQAALKLTPTNMSPTDVLSFQSQSDRATNSTGSKTPASAGSSDGSRSPPLTQEHSGEQGLSAEDDVLTTNGILESLSALVDSPRFSHGSLMAVQSAPVSFPSHGDLQEALLVAGLHSTLKKLNLA